MTNRNGVPRGKREELTADKTPTSDEDLSLYLSKLSKDFRQDNASWANPKQSTNLFLEWEADHADVDERSSQYPDLSPAHRNKFSNGPPETDPISRFLQRIWSTYSAR